MKPSTNCSKLISDLLFELRILDTYISYLSFHLNRSHMSFFALHRYCGGVQFDRTIPLIDFFYRSSLGVEKVTLYRPA